jgi:hypothetical protein
MIDFLLGVPGKLKTISDWLTTYWTAARAAKVDNLDAAVSTRAAAATALSTATWTNARAAALDSIGASVIRSIQSDYAYSGAPAAGGRLSKYMDVAIAAVTVNKSIVLIQDAQDGSAFPATGYLTSANNLRLETSGLNISAVWTVVEFK